MKNRRLVAHDYFAKLGKPSETMNETETKQNRRK